MDMTFTFNEQGTTCCWQASASSQPSTRIGLINRLLTEAQQQKRAAEQPVPMSSSEFEHAMAQKQHPLNSGAGVVAS
jgi:hypothetical protein